LNLKYSGFAGEKRARICELLEQRVVEVESRYLEKNSQQIKDVGKGKVLSVSFWSNATHRRHSLRDMNTVVVLGLRVYARF